MNKRTLFSAGVFLFFSLAAMAQTAGPRADSNPAAETEVKALISKMAAMIVQGDWDAYAQRLAPDYLRTGYDGQVENKDEALAHLRDPQRKIIIMEMEPDQHVCVYGETAISNAEFTISVRESGHVKTHRVRMTDVLVKHDGQWYAIAEQATAIGK